MRRIGLILVSLLGLSCDLFRSPDYYPIELGSVWKYGSGEASRIDSVVGRTLLDSGDEAWIMVRRLEDDKPTLDTVFIVKDATEVEEYQDRAGTNPKRVLLLPLELGDNWEYTAPELGRVTVKVESELKVQTPAGNFTCFRVVHKTDTISFYEDFAPDVGLVHFTLADASEWGLKEY